MLVNTQLVRALMALKGVTVPALALAAGVREQNLRAWLSDLEASDLFLLEHSQTDVLRALGIDLAEECPRADVVHVWQLRQPAWNASAAYQPIAAVVAAFGPAELVHFALERDPWLTLTARSVFGLKFPKFRAVLTVQTWPWAAVGLDQAGIDGLAWTVGSAVCALPADLQRRMARGDVTVFEFDNAMSGKPDLWRWERLALLARERGVTADEVELWVTQKAVPGLAAPATKDLLQLPQRDPEAAPTGIFVDRRRAA